MEALIGLALLLLLAVAAERWGVDSTDGLDSLEWERRRTWRGFEGSTPGRPVPLSFPLDLFTAYHRHLERVRRADAVGFLVEPDTAAHQPAGRRRWPVRLRPRRRGQYADGLLPRLTEPRVHEGFGHR